MARFGARSSPCVTWWLFQFSFVRLRVVMTQATPWALVGGQVTRMAEPSPGPRWLLPAEDDLIRAIGRAIYSFAQLERSVERARRENSRVFRFESGMPAVHEPPESAAPSSRLGAPMRMR